MDTLFWMIVVMLFCMFETCAIAIASAVIFGIVKVRTIATLSVYFCVSVIVSILLYNTDCSMQVQEDILILTYIICIVITWCIKQNMKKTNKEDSLNINSGGCTVIKYNDTDNIQVKFKGSVWNAVIVDNDTDGGEIENIEKSKKVNINDVLNVVGIQGNVLLCQIRKNI